MSRIRPYVSAKLLGGLASRRTTVKRAQATIPVPRRRRPLRSFSSNWVRPTSSRGPWLGRNLPRRVGRLLKLLVEENESAALAHGFPNGEARQRSAASSPSSRWYAPREASMNESCPPRESQR
jgi:hypothetical protein